MPKQVKTIIRAFLSPHQTLEQVEKGNAIPVFTSGEGSYWRDEGYALIGEAEVTVPLMSRKDIRSGQLVAARSALAKVRAENQARENVALDHLRKLEAIEFTPS